MSDLKFIIGKLAEGSDLSQDEAIAAFDVIMSGNATPSQIGAFLMGLRAKGETVDEIAGAVTIMRDKMIKVEAPAGAIDIVGTGGDAKGTYNISTCTAFVVAGCGVTVAKHGNRAVSSRSGAADVLKALGVNIDIDARHVGRCVGDAGIGFMFAPLHHPAMKNVGPSRMELGMRTIFNLLGPLSNPASVRRYLLGVYDPKWVGPVANALNELGAERAIVVHGDGMDEMTTTGETICAELKNGTVHTYTVAPENLGITRTSMNTLIGGDADYNASAIKRVLDGEEGPLADIVCLNAGAALTVADKAENIETGIQIARDAITSGKPKAVLQSLVTVSNTLEV